MQFGLIQVLGLPFRGHSGNINVWLSLLKFIAARESVLREHLNGDKKIKYLCKTITVEQIVVMANEHYSCRSTSDSGTVCRC